MSSIVSSANYSIRITIQLRIYYTLPYRQSDNGLQTNLQMMLGIFRFIVCYVIVTQLRPSDETR